MTGHDKITAAFSPSGVSQVGVVSGYVDIFVRDHWRELTAVPWWYINSGVIEKEVAWAQDVFAKSGLEWLRLAPCLSRETRQQCRYEERPDGVWRIDESTGQAIQMVEPTPSGTNTACAADKHFDQDSLVFTMGEIDRLIPGDPCFDRDAFLSGGQQDVAMALRDNLNLAFYGLVTSPLCMLYHLIGYEGMMLLIAEHPDLALYAGQRLLANVKQKIGCISTLGADAVWIEEIFTDQINPEAFSRINVPLMQQCVNEIRRHGLKSIYYYCGNPNDRLDRILDVGADAIHFEESKKNFTVDIEELAAKINGRCVLFGNLDSIGVLQKGSESELASEIQRQIKAGVRNKGRFVMSTGSPITPETPVTRVRQYTDLVRDSVRRR
ncbi:MAG: hypothetical protein KKG09_10340 [Verrucomicrobia bacterium]|nr:hypothetical protein [Verrucomicrobiota bacterium]MCG2681839.1 hypothetical protein [Kiritimatiellia bacterium]MBU4247721.1 hypothetical protein [Verrucomicrobiota bacterium]MBU4291628.1 hypothetical protein [Verrucomicrobiota bacterium]MBU4429555.1 hypothetical protein [Verrucomicrobiota bacterium]